MKHQTAAHRSQDARFAPGSRAHLCRNPNGLVERSLLRLFDEKVRHPLLFLQKGDGGLRLRFLFLRSDGLLGCRVNGHVSQLVPIHRIENLETHAVPPRFRHGGHDTEDPGTRRHGRLETERGRVVTGELQHRCSSAQGCGVCELGQVNCKPRFTVHHQSFVLHEELELIGPVGDRDGWELFVVHV